MIADDLVQAMEPWLTPDFEDYLRAIGQMFRQIELYSEDEDEDDGWSILLDVDRVPADALPYLAQFVGERLPIGIVEADAREWVKDAPNQRRGTVESIVRVAQRHLTGQRTVSLLERAGDAGADAPDKVRVITYTSETPDAQKVYDALIRDAIPGDMTLTHQVLAGATWGGVKTTYSKWGDVKTSNATWEQVRLQKVGYTTVTRPRVP